MNVLYEFPFGFAALATIPLLVGIYLLRNRFHRLSVSSLMLWGIQRKHKQGGLNLDRLQTPLLFILELLIFLLLTLAAAGPLLRSRTDTRRMVVVLDDSISMLAEGGDARTTRQRTVHELQQSLKASSPFQVSFIRAGAEATVLARDIDTLSEVSSVLDNWRCLSATADLNAAIMLAGQMASQRDRILVISDHAADAFDDDSRIEYRALGRPVANAGFVHAERTRVGNRDKCMFSIGTFSENAQTVTLTVTSPDGKTQHYRREIELVPDQPHQLVLEVPKYSPVTASITDDALSIDNNVTLLHLPDNSVRVAVDLESEMLSKSVSRILDILPDAEEVPQNEHVRVTDKPRLSNTSGSPWTLHILSDPNAAAFVGPFVVNRMHPLAEGLDLQGIIWAASGDRRFQSVPVISAGNTALLQVRQGDGNGRHIELYLNPEISTLTRSTNWPILFWNLIHWRQQSLPGLQGTNWRIGSQVAFEPPENGSDVRLLRPDGKRDLLSNPAGTIIIEADRPGVYQIETQTNRYAFAVNALSADESDLRGCRTQHITNADQAVHFWWEYRSYHWLLLLIAVSLLGVHGFLVFYQSNRRVA